MSRSRIPATGGVLSIPVLQNGRAARGHRRLLIICCVLAGAAPMPRGLSSQSTVVVDTTPLITIPQMSMSGGEPSHVVGPILLPDGSMAWGDTHGGTLTFADSLGHTLVVLGRVGDGPREFHHIAWIAQCGRDSVAVWDLILRRMTVIEHKGGAWSTFAFPSQTGDFAQSPILACSAGGEFVYQLGPTQLAPVTHVVSTDPQTQVVRGQAAVAIRTHLTDTIGASIPNVLAGEVVISHGGAGPRPLGKNTFLAVASDRLYLATDDSQDIGIYRFDGAQIGSIKLPVPPRAPTPANVSSALAAIVSTIRTEVRGRVRSWLSSVQEPTSLPPYAGLIVDPRDLLWVSVSMPGDENSRLDVVDSTGHLVAHVVLPHLITVTDVGERRLVGVRQQADGTQEIVVLPLRREGRTAH